MRRKAFIASAVVAGIVGVFAWWVGEPLAGLALAIIIGYTSGAWQGGEGTA
jgi:divalent metal cation (Fe/Co/Zn/Cd) transporter